MENNHYLKLTSIIYRSFQQVNLVISKDIATFGLNDAEFGTLEVLYHKGKLPIIQIGQKMLMANSSMTYVIDKLLSKGLIQQQMDMNDRRNKLIELTEKGHHLFHIIFSKHQETLKNIYEVLNEDEIILLSQLLKKVGYHAKDLGSKTI